jgi:hypothetical protein
MTSPLFTVILVNWNTSGLLVEAVRSALHDGESSGISIEVIVVDNGSTDDSVAAVHAAFPQVVTLENGQNLGFSRAVNRALAIHKGDHVLLLNTDARLETGALSAFLETFERDSRAGIIGANLCNEDGTPQNSAAPFPTLASELLNKSLLKLLFPQRFRTKVPAGETACFEAGSVIGAALAIRKEALSDIGPLDERFFFFFEETDWCWQARRLGWKVVVNPKARVIHGQGKSSEKVLADSRIEFYRSRYRYFRKNKGALQAAVLFAGMLVKLTVETISAALVYVLSFGQSERARRRLGVVATLLAWHLLGCPASWGLEGRFLGR